MATTSEIQRHTTAAERDTVIGGVLSRTIAETASGTPCPTTEQLAMLIDGSSQEPERDTLFGHIACCERCRTIFLLAGELNSAGPSPQQQRRGWYLPCGLAAAALVVLALTLTLPEPEPAPRQAATQLPTPPQNVTRNAPPAKPVTTVKTGIAPFSTAAAARQLAGASSAGSLAAVVGAPGSGAYGFAGSSSRSTAFRAGNVLFELELWLAARDKEQAALTAERLVPLLQTGDNNRTTLDNLITHIEAGQFDKVINLLENMTSPSDRETFRLGSWTAAAKVAVATGADPFFAGNPPRYFLTQCGDRLPAEAHGILDALEKIRSDNNPAEIRRLLDALAETL